MSMRQSKLAAAEAIRAYYASPLPKPVSQAPQPRFGTAPTAPAAANVPVVPHES